MVLALTRPPVAPSTLRPETFAEEMDDRLAWQDINVDEMNQVLPLVEGAASAGTSAAASAAAAALSAASALAAPGTNATSTTSLTVSAGVLAIAIQANKDIVPGAWLMCARTADPDGVWMLGQARSYIKATGALSLVVAAGDTKGTGTFNDWTLSLSSARSTVFNAVDLALVGPSSLPSLLADFANTRRLPPGFVYTMASEQTYYDVTGTRRTAPAGTPVFDHDPITGECLAIQMFEARTNLTLRSDEFDNSGAWTVLGATISANSAVSPTGATTMDKLVENTSNSQHYVAQAYASQPAGTYTYSCDVQPAGRTQVMLLQAAGPGHSVVFNLVAMTATTDLGGATGRIIPLRGGNYRLEMTFTTVTALALNMRHLLMTASTTTYAGDGVSGAYWGAAQLEAGASATPVIPTTSAAVTRAAPQLYINTDSAWFNALEGTLFVTSSRPAAGGIAKGVAGLAGVGGNYVSIAYNASVTVLSGDIVTSSVSQLSQTVVVGAGNSAALAYKTNDSTFSCNGSTPVTDTSVTVPAVTKLYIGDIDGTGYSANTRISKVAYWPRRLSNTELTALTTQ